MRYFRNGWLTALSVERLKFIADIIARPKFARSLIVDLYVRSSDNYRKMFLLLIPLRILSRLIQLGFLTCHFAIKIARAFFSISFRYIYSSFPFIKHKKTTPPRPPNKTIARSINADIKKPSRELASALPHRRGGKWKEIAQRWAVNGLKSRIMRVKIQNEIYTNPWRVVKTTRFGK